MKAYCLNNISKVALGTLSEPDCTVDAIENSDCILVRSADMHGMELPRNVLAVARAGAGVNNIPLDEYALKGIPVFNTPGANANAVKELVLCSLFLASRDIIGGNAWVKENTNDENIGKDAEKAKSKFAGNEIYGKTIAILGLGKIGILVANACTNLGMKVVGYDPYLTVLNATQLDRNIKYVEKISDAVADADFITVHIPANSETKGMLNSEIFGHCKDGVVLLNFSRDVLVNDDDLLATLESGKIKKYVTDFANAKVVKMSNTIVLPHLGASTEEAEDNCAMMAIDQLKEYLENGNLINSVNYPNANAGVKQSEHRLCIFHKNIPGMIAKFSTILSNESANIENLVNKSKGDFAYTILDYDGKIDLCDISNVDEVLKIRLI